MKTDIRKAEANSAALYSGVPLENIHFLEMPFYDTGRVKKSPLTEQDIQLNVDIMEKIKPHQIYATGDLSEPHGTYRICCRAIKQPLEQCGNSDWMKECYVWLCRWIWMETMISDMDVS